MGLASALGSLAKATVHVIADLTIRVVGYGVKVTVRRVSREALEYEARMIEEYADLDEVQRERLRLGVQAAIASIEADGEAGAAAEQYRALVALEGKAMRAYVRKRMRNDGISLPPQRNNPRWTIRTRNRAQARIAERRAREYSQEV